MGKGRPGKGKQCQSNSKSATVRHDRRKKRDNKDTLAHDSSYDTAGAAASETSCTFEEMWDADLQSQCPGNTAHNFPSIIVFLNCCLLKPKALVEFWAINKVSTINF